MKKLLTQFNQLSQNLRWLVMMFMAVLILWGWWDYICLPLHQYSLNVAVTRQATAQKVRDIQAEYMIYKNLSQASPEEIAQHIRLLEKQLDNFNKNILLNKNSLTSSSALQPVLQALAKTPTGIVIQQLQLEPVSKQDPSKQGIALKFRGDFFATLHYLKYIEGLPWFLVYDRLNYSVTQYPEADVSVFLVPV